MTLYIESITKERTYSEPIKPFYWVYAHGILEKMAGYDIVNRSRSNNFNTKSNVIMDVTANLPNGKEMPARLFYWQRPTYKIPVGLVVAVSDTPALEYAQQKYNERAEII